MAAGTAGFAQDNEAPKRLVDIVATVAAGQMVFPCPGMFANWTGAA